jgi:hypothetical protein
MTMNFILLKASIVTLLGDNAAGRFVTIGYQKQAQAAAAIENELRTVQVFYKRGEYPKSAGSLSGPVAHDMNFGIYMAVSRACEGDLAALENPSSTPAEKQAALLALRTGEDLVDGSIDELHDHVFQILMDARNQDLGLEPVRVGNRWVEGYEKDDILRNGELVQITGSMPLSARMEEDVPGETGTDLETIDMGLQHSDDVAEVPIAGVINNGFNP